MTITDGKRALIFGINGQDGALLARLLIERGYKVHGTSRDHEVANFANLRRVGIFEQVALHSASLGDYRAIIEIIAAVRPVEIHNLAAQSSVGLSFNQPVNTINSTIIISIADWKLADAGPRQAWRRHCGSGLSAAAL